MDWEDYERHEENRRVIDAGGKLIAGILVVATALAIALTFCFA